jgi:hypothetical protein
LSNKLWFSATKRINQRYSLYFSQGIFVKDENHGFSAMQDDFPGYFSTQAIETCAPKGVMVCKYAHLFD